MSNWRCNGQFLELFDDDIMDGCPAIVPRDLFDRVQKKLGKQKVGEGASKARYPYLLS